MRALLFLVAGLVLAACSSPVASPSANPQTLNAAGRMLPADPGIAHLTLVFKNITYGAIVSMDALRFSCITSVTPKTFNINPSRSKTVNIDASIVDRCAHDTAEVDFDTTLSDPHYGVWKGGIDIWHNPEKSEWTAKMRGTAGQFQLCTEPNLREGDQLYENEEIYFVFC